MYLIYPAPIRPEEMNNDSHRPRDRRFRDRDRPRCMTWGDPTISGRLHDCMIDEDFSHDLQDHMIGDPT